MLPYARVLDVADDGTHEIKECPLCLTPIRQPIDATGEPTSNEYADHYAREHVESVTLTYDPRVADPNPVDGSNVHVGTVAVRYADGSFDFAPSYGGQPWTVCRQEIERGDVAIDPKQVLR